MGCINTYVSCIPKSFHSLLPSLQCNPFSSRHNTRFLSAIWLSHCLHHTYALLCTLCTIKHIWFHIHSMGYNILSREDILESMLHARSCEWNDEALPNSSSNIISICSHALSHCLHLYVETRVGAEDRWKWGSK